MELVCLLHNGRSSETNVYSNARLGVLENVDQRNAVSVYCVFAFWALHARRFVLTAARTQARVCGTAAFKPRTHVPADVHRGEWRQTGRFSELTHSRWN